MKNLTAAACLAAGAMAATCQGEAFLACHWPGVDLALACMGAVAWSRRDAGPGAFPAYAGAFPAMLIATVAGSSHAPHCVVSAEAELAGCAIAAGIAAWTAWMAAGTVGALLPRPRGGFPA